MCFERLRKRKKLKEQLRVFLSSPENKLGLLVWGYGWSPETTAYALSLRRKEKQKQAGDDTSSNNSKQP